MKTKLNQLNDFPADKFVEVCGPLFEHSPWVAERTARRRPFANCQDLHGALCQTVAAASPEEQLQLVRAHPDLVGRAAQLGQLTAASNSEQAAAGLGNLTPQEIQSFQKLNAAYWAKFEFPLVICARENKKDAILAAFPARLTSSRDEELATALAEIFKIARLRLLDAIEED
jgi:2-oxo-4-hydroxy-4-carboxy-5-ureidoimidazoline decarboxylase